MSDRQNLSLKPMYQLVHSVSIALLSQLNEFANRRRLSIFVEESRHVCVSFELSPSSTLQNRRTDSGADERGNHFCDGFESSLQSEPKKLDLHS